MVLEEKNIPTFFKETKVVSNILLSVEKGNKARKSNETKLQNRTQVQPIFVMSMCACE